MMSVIEWLGGNRLLQLRKIKRMEIKFEPFKTRQQIADELNISTRYLRKKINISNINISKGRRLGIKEQMAIYIALLGESSLSKTQYENYMNDKSA